MDDIDVTTLPLDPIETIPRMVITMAQLRQVVSEEVSKILPEIDQRIDTRLEAERRRTVEIIEEKVDATEVRLNASINVLGEAFKNTLERIEIRINGIHAVVEADREVKADMRADINRNEQDIRAHDATLVQMGTLLTETHAAIHGNGHREGPQTIYGALKEIKENFGAFDLRINARLTPLESWVAEWQRIQAENAARRARMWQVAGTVASSKWVWGAVVAIVSLLAGVSGGIDLSQLFNNGG